MSCCLPPFPNPTDHARLPEVVYLNLPQPQQEQLNRAAAPELLLQTAWALLLRCYTGSDEVCFGCYQSNLEDQGASANIQPVSFSIAESDLLQDLVHHRQTLENAQGDEANRLFNTIICFVKVQTETPSSIPQSDRNPLPETCRIQFLAEQRPEETRLALEYWRDEVSREHVTCMGSALGHVLRLLLSEGTCAVRNVDLFTDEDLQRLARWNTALPRTQEICVHEVIGGQCRLQPAKDAISAWDGRLTYSELDAQTSRLAHYLQSRGVGLEDRVPLCFEKSKWYTVAMIAVLKTGAAFVPLDPSHPKQRLQSLTQAVGASIVLCSTRYTVTLQNSAVSVPIIAVDDSLLEQCTEISVSSTVKPGNAAYVLFTSGSTGEPKGTLVEHRAFSSSSLAHSGPLRINSDCRVFQFAAHTFDASLCEILTPLMNGATVCVPSEEARVNDLAGAINGFNANHLCLTPSVIEFLSPSMVPEVTTLVLAGEAMSASQRDMWCHKVNLVNGFGPTETSITSAVNSTVTVQTDCRDIGTPVGGFCWIVDPQDHNRLVPVGAPGEMLVEGPSLARCYLNNPEKTADAFIFDPAWTQQSKDRNQPRRRFYKTGDLVRYNSEMGTLSYVGRKDTQVKLHGQRVELGEIESRLSADGDVHHALVLVPRAGYAKGKLTTVVCLSGSYEVKQEELVLDASPATQSRISGLRQRLSSRLPSYMIPNIWLNVSSLPLLPSGKLDRKMVARWLVEIVDDPQFQPAEDDTQLCPENETEKQLALIWSRVLNIPLARIRLNDSFLKLGGDSLAAMTCASQCKKSGLGLSVQDILRAQSIRELARHTTSIKSVATYRETIDEWFDLSPIQHLHSLVRKEDQGYFNQSILTRVNERVNIAKLRQAVEALISRHSMLRARFSLSGPEQKMRQRITREVSSSYRLAGHTVAGKQEVDAIIGDSQQRIDCVAGPVMAVDLIDVAGQGQLLSLVGHHLVVDIVSWRLIIEELEELILDEGKAAMTSSSMPFQTWCVQQAEHCGNFGNELNDIPLYDDHRRLLSFWGVDESFNTTYGDVQCASFQVDLQTTSLILTGCHESLKTEPVDVLLACLLKSFSLAFPDGPAPVIHNEGHGREPWDASIDISRTVGWFTTLYPIWSRQISEQDLVQTVINVKDNRRRAVDNGRAFFAYRTLTEAGHEKYPHPTPMGISFNYLGQNRDLQRRTGLFNLADQMVGETREGGGAADFGRDTPRFALFEISAAVIAGQLRFTFSFNKSIRHLDRVADWLSYCKSILNDLSRQLHALPATRTPGDFPLLPVTYNELQKVCTETLPQHGIASLDQVEDMYPCTRMQQGTLLSRYRNPALYAVHITFEVKFPGQQQPNTDHLVEAWNRLVSYHSMLRTVFVPRLTANIPFAQIVLKAATTRSTRLERDDEAQAIAAFESQNPVESYATHRFSVCQTRSGQLFCRLEMNHAAMDGGSISLLLRDLRRALGGGAVSFDNIKSKPDFKAFVHYLQRQSPELGLDYWCSYLKDIQPCHFPVNTSGTPTGNLRTLRVEYPDLERLHTFCQTTGITHSTVFNAAWGLLLSSLTGSDDVCFSYTTSLRDAPVNKIDAIIGPIMNLAVCRVKPTTAATMLSVLQHMQSDYMECLPYRSCSLIEIQHRLKLAQKSLFNSGVSYRKLPAEPSSDTPSVEFVQKGLIHDPAEMAVYINVEAEDRQAQIELNYWTDCLSSEQAHTSATLFLAHVDSIIDYASRGWTELLVASDEQKAQFQAHFSSKIPLTEIESCYLLELGDASAKHGLQSEYRTLKRATKLYTFCQENTLSASAVYGFVWAILLRLYSGSPEVCFGTVQDRKSTHPLGICSSLVEDDAFVLDAIRQQHSIPLPDGFESSQDNLFNTVLCVNPSSDADLTASGILSHLESGKFAVAICASLTSTSGTISAHYSPKSVSKAYIDSLMACFEHILNQLPSAGLKKRIGDLNLVDDETCAQLQVWNRSLPVQSNKCAHDMIAERAQHQNPSAPAICSWDGSMTYFELWASSMRLSQHLRRLGVRPETFVALLFEKSSWAIVAQLAVLQAGGAFVSLDPLHAEGRLETLVSQLGAPIMLCSPEHYELSSRICNVAFAVDESVIDELPESPPSARGKQASLSNAAYAIFTSGTTGTPKATVVQHSALTTSAQQWATVLRFNTKTRTFQFSSFTFDVSVMDVFFTLINGGCVCIPSETERMNDLAGAIRRTSATLLSGIPSLVNTLDPKSVPTLKTLVMGGEKMPTSFISRWSDRRIINAYGPSEATVVATASAKTDGSGAVLNTDCSDIGVAFCGRSWVVDSANFNRLLPFGAVGELLMEGANVAREYLHNKKKTQQVFVNDPHWVTEPRMKESFGLSERMYRTGDLVRYKPDGTLSFIARADTQVKLKGQRVELGEIEHHCKSLLPFQSEVVVDIVVPQEGTMSRGLAAFFTTSLQKEEEEELVNSDSDGILLSMTADRIAVVNGLRQQLPQRLPRYMVPTFFFPVRYQPRTTSSKFDRRRLKRSVESLKKEELKLYSHSVSTRSQKTGSNGLETTLRGLWEEVMNLTVGSVTDEDSFFSLGGDSFAAMNLVSAAQSVGITLTVATIFKYPTLSEMAAHCESDSSNAQLPKTAIIPSFSLLTSAEDTKEVLDEAADFCQVKASSIVDVYPCSPVQEGLITSSTTQQGAYVVRSIYQLAESVDLDVFRSAWQKTVDEVEILRTRIVHTAAANFCQVVLQSTPIKWTYRTDLPTASEELPALPDQHGGCLTHYAIATSESSRYFLWSLHHAVYDGWSVPLILRKAQTYYLQLTKTQPATVTPVMPYNLFIDYLAKVDVDASDRFWKAYLAGYNTPSFPRIQEVSKPNAGQRQLISIDIKRPSNATSVTVPVMVRAAWALVIAEQSESQDVCFGETLMGRNIDLPGVTEMGGPVLTTVPTRIQVDRQMSVKAYLQRVQKQMLEMIPHQHAGLQRIRKLDQGASAACGFQNLLVVQQNDEESLDDTVWSFSEIHASREFFTYPLVVECKVAPNQIHTTAHHDETTILGYEVERLINQFHFVLKQILDISSDKEDGSWTVAMLDLVTPADKRQIADWNSKRLAPVKKTIHDLIWDQCALQPESEAICAWDGRLSYREMCEYAAAFAKYLVSLGVGPEIFVPVCMDKSVWMVVAILGVMAAGGAYVPLDPAHPTSRHEEIIADVDASLLLCSSAYRKKYTKTVKTVLPVDQEVFQSLPIGSLYPPMNRATSSNMAYALFTSGSTGRPKGIVTEHASFVSSVMAFGPVVNLQRGTRAFHFASMTFDAAVMEVWGALIFGGCVCIPSEEERLNHVAGAMHHMNISWTFCTPSVAAIIEPSSVPALKTLVCGGEMLSAEVINKWSRHVELINGYGPTETSVFATLNTGISPSTEPACIGRGIRSTCTWVVDPDNHDRLMPVGVVGELCLSGRPLAREYLKRPEKTATEFIDNPRWARDFPGSSASRIYKTGDLVRYYPDGSVEYLGRKDHQVKLHGQRMELGEIESRLGEHQSIRHAVVLLPKTGLLKKRLIAILSLNGVSSNQQSLIMSNARCQMVEDGILQSAGLSCIQNSLQEQLPIYMVPQAWIVMQSLPMLVSGKIDRKQITAWVEQVDKVAYERIMQDYDTIKRRRDVETVQKTSATAMDVLREVCAQVLDISSVDVTRSFISLGGDSITGMAVVSRARKQGMTVRLQDILQTTSLEELSKRAKFSVVPSNTAEETDKLFGLSPIQELYFRSATRHRDTDRFNQSVIVRITRWIDSNKLQNALRAIVGRHGMLRARFVKVKNGAWQQKITKDIEESYKLCMHTAGNPEDMNPIMAASQRALDIERGPIMRADLIDVTGTEQVLFLVANHLCIDMVSWRVILQDLEEYLLTGTIASERPFSFHTWCAMHQNGKRTGGIQSAEKPVNAKYWGLESSTNTYGQVKTKTFVLDEETTTFALGRLHETIQTEPLDLLLAVAFRSFAQTFTDRELPTIYNESHGRQSSTDSAIDVSGTVGWFTALKPLCVASLPETLVDTMRLIKQNRQTQQNLSDLSEFPQPLEIMFNYLGRFQQLERQDALFQHYRQVFDESEMTRFGDMGPNTSRFALFELTAIVLQDRLQISFTFNRDMKRQEQLGRWMSAFEKTFKQACLHLDTVAANSLPSFPLLPATPGEMEQLLESVLPRLGIKEITEIEDIYPVSPVQEGILLSQLRDPASYIFHTVFEITDNRTGRPINVDALASAWQQVTDRHAILRTAFVESNYKNGTFDQVILKQYAATVNVMECDSSEALSRLDTITLGEAKRKTAHLQHQITICRAPTRPVLLKMEINHALIDGGSISIILRDFSAAYSKQLAKGPGPQYSKYIQYLQSIEDTGGIAYWTEYLRGVTPCSLPVSSNKVAKRRLSSIKIGFDRFDALQALCRQNSITFANLALATWALVLRALTGQDDVCFGYLSAGRDAPVPDIQDAAGVFINMLCCRVQFSDQQSFVGVFKQMQSDYLAGLPHQTCSLAHIQHQLGISGDKTLFNTTVSIQNRMPSDGTDTDALSFEALQVHDPTEFPMTVNAVTARGHEGIMLRFWSDSVTNSQAQGIATAIVQVFETALARPFDSISTFSGLLDLGTQTPDVPTPPYDITKLIDSKALHKLIDERVREIVGQIIRRPNLQRELLTPSSTPARSQENLTNIIAASLNLSPSSSYSSDGDPEPKTIGHSFEACTLGKATRKASPELRRKLLGLWSTALETPTYLVKPQDSFFRVGGDSIKAMKMASAGREEGLSLRVSDIFQSPVFEDLLELIASNTAVASSNTPATPAAIPIKGKTKLTPSTSPSTSPPDTNVYNAVRLDYQFVQRNIFPKIGFVKGDVSDILPVTDFQTLSLTAQQFDSRWMLNYFYFDGTGPLDILRLRESCSRVIESFDVLRSVFVCSGPRFYQVVLKKITVDLTVCETDQSLDDFTAGLQKSDREQPIKQGEPFVKFFVGKRLNSNHHRILIRLSHAQYDGVCLSKLLGAIKQGYEGGTLPLTSSFASHMRLLSSSVTPDHFQHYKSLLQGSKMPQVIRRNGPNTYQYVGDSTAVMRTVDISMAANANITIATVVQAAWALTLAKMCAQSDVVFGLTINGRNAGVPGIETAVGPCVNIVPVRVRFGEGWNGLDLFRYIQDQQVANMPYENLGFRDIIHNCTDWPKWSYFTTTVFHQSVQYEGQIQLDDNTYRIGGAGVIDDLSDLTLLSTPMGENRFGIALHYSKKGPIEAPFASRILDMACDVIEGLTTSPSSVLPSPTTLQSLPVHTVDELPRPSDEQFLSSHLKKQKIADLLVYSPPLTRAWQQVLTPYKATEFYLESSFFSLGGDLFSMAQVAALLQQEGLSVRLEDLLEHPTFLGQMAVLALRNEPKEAEKAIESAPVKAFEMTEKVLEDPVSSPSVQMASTEKTKSEGGRGWTKAFTFTRKFRSK
ncbi:hypothetical protein ASPZODRAFT_13447 [Penicilliopsis zonata CBS 506.65]|uniref:Carrier domain-containing protein n=1 Tax=Penicilliopsis zonata CBS 506.65 TaxID=1073090 RepID=A0A1L9STE7_9EURO|nr:hypothetical protein ASPZODRAFT_13447 [Penicilliopsis zonata CBS 506.65]OJJ50363.1 hypothetical protein ASPZODRAFT_13447 [Penicilliopsis zonata CBS 506.65]